MLKHKKIFGGFLLIYFLAYTGLTLSGSYQPILINTRGIRAYGWWPWGFHPDKSEGLHPVCWTLAYAFYPLWMLDMNHIHKYKDGNYEPTH
jgi:hypothetical protein